MIHVINFNSTGVGVYNSTCKCWKNISKNKMKSLKYLSTNLIDMYTMQLIIVVFFCKNLSRHRVYLHNWIKGLR